MSCRRVCIVWRTGTIPSSPSLVARFSWQATPASGSRVSYLDGRAWPTQSRHKVDPSKFVITSVFLAFCDWPALRPSVVTSCQSCHLASAGSGGRLAKNGPAAGGPESSQAKAKKKGEKKISPSTSLLRVTSPNFLLVKTRNALTRVSRNACVKKCACAFVRERTSRTIAPLPCSGDDSQHVGELHSSATRLSGRHPSRCSPPLCLNHVGVICTLAVRTACLASRVACVRAWSWLSHPRPPDRSQHGCTAGVDRDPPV